MLLSLADDTNFVGEIKKFEASKLFHTLVDPKLILEEEMSWKDGSFVNEAAKTIMEQIEVGLTQSIVDEFEVSPLDAVGILKLVSIIHNPNDASSVPNTPLNARGSSGASNP
ncbi:hypothetical protein GmHk_14G041247 [Glycine max]|nr:hypothetical protein GmHk_14G041247 [Glycine max]